MLDESQPLIVSIVIPVFNELNTIEELLRRVHQVVLGGVEKEIVIVDDGSTDGTALWLGELLNTIQAGRDPAWAGLSRHYIKVLFHTQNLGKGAALHRGFREARGDIVLVQDADLEYNPQDYESLLMPILNDTADVVYGSRFLSPQRPMWTMAGYIGNKLITALSNVLTGLSLSDVWTGYKVFKRSVIHAMTLNEAGFELELELTGKVAQGRWRICEVPISYFPRSRAEGKKITWKDGIKAIRCMFRYRRRKLLGQPNTSQNLLSQKDS
ncbi:MAG: glycosyltransferase family 2 protein [Nitrospirales bacterium]